MNVEARLALRLAIRVVALMLVVAAAAGRSIGYSTGPLWVAVPVSITVILLTYARLVSRRSGGKPPHALVWDTAKRGGAGVKRLVERARRRERVRRVELAALEAAEGDDRLSPDSVRTSAEALFRLVQLAWEARDPGRLATLLGPELMAKSEQRIAQVPRSGRDERLEVVGEVRVEYVGFTVPNNDMGPRVVVLIEATVRAFAQDHRDRQADAELRHMCEYWTLGLADGLWTVLAIEDRAEGKHHLAEPIGAPSAVPR